MKVGKMARLVICLLGKHEGFIESQNPHRKLSVLANAYHPSSGRWRCVDPWASLARQPSLLGDTQDPVRDIASKNKVDGF